MRKYSDMFRPNYDAFGFVAWTMSALMLVVLRPPLAHFMFPIALCMAYVRYESCVELYRFWISINSQSLVFRPIEVVLQNFRAQFQDKCYWLGYGFKWDQSCAEIAQQILLRNEGELKDIPQWMKRAFNHSLSVPKAKRNPIETAIAAFAKSISPRDVVANSSDIVGQHWIHGLAVYRETHVPLPITAAEGHTLILGTTGAGKTRLYETICTQLIHSNKCLIVIDPKKDVDWRNRLEKECNRVGRKFLNFDLARPSQSVYIDPLSNFNSILEVGLRIAQLVDADGSFAAFASKTLARITSSLSYVGIKPNIKGIRQFVMLGVEPIASKALTKYLFEKFGPNWDRDINSKGTTTQPKKDALDPRLEAMINLYLKEAESSGNRVDSIDGLIAMLKHSREHYSKMIQVLEPILELLGAGEIGDLLSPDYTSHTNLKDIWNFKGVIEENCVLYIGLDSLSNGITATAVGSIFLADLAACAGAFYNAGLKKDIYLMIDEAGEALNDQATQLLNKGRGAGFKLFVATQTIADLVVRYGSAPKATQALGNLNNLICLRLKDMETAEYVSKIFGMTEYRTLETGYSSGTESSANVTEFRGSTSRSMRAKEIALVSTDLLTSLPSMHYFANIAGGTKWKGRVPLIVD